MRLFVWTHSCWRFQSKIESLVFTCSGFCWLIIIEFNLYNYLFEFILLFVDCVIHEYNSRYRMPWMWSKLKFYDWLEPISWLIILTSSITVNHSLEFAIDSLEGYTDKVRGIKVWLAPKKAWLPARVFERNHEKNAKYLEISKVYKIRNIVCTAYKL